MPPNWEELLPRTFKLIDTHWRAVSALAEALYQRERLSAYEVYRVCKTNGLEFGHLAMEELRTPPRATADEDPTSLDALIEEMRKAAN